MMIMAVANAAASPARPSGRLAGRGAGRCRCRRPFRRTRDMIWDRVLAGIEEADAVHSHASREWRPDSRRTSRARVPRIPRQRGARSLRTRPEGGPRTRPDPAGKDLRFPAVRNSAAPRDALSDLTQWVRNTILGVGRCAGRSCGCTHRRRVSGGPLPTRGMTRAAITGLLAGAPGWNGTSPPAAPAANAVTAGGPGAAALPGRRREMTLHSGPVPRLCALDREPRLRPQRQAGRGRGAAYPAPSPVRQGCSTPFRLCALGPGAALLYAHGNQSAEARAEPPHMIGTPETPAAVALERCGFRRALSCKPMPVFHPHPGGKRVAAVSVAIGFIPTRAGNGEKSSGRVMVHPVHPRPCLARLGPWCGAAGTIMAFAPMRGKSGCGGGAVLRCGREQGPCGYSRGAVRNASCGTCVRFRSECGSKGLSPRGCRQGRNVEFAARVEAPTFPCGRSARGRRAPEPGGDRRPHAPRPFQAGPPPAGFPSPAPPRGAGPTVPPAPTDGTPRARARRAGSISRNPGAARRPGRRPAFQAQRASSTGTSVVSSMSRVAPPRIASRKREWP